MNLGGRGAGAGCPCATGPWGLQLPVAEFWFLFQKFAEGARLGVFLSFFTGKMPPMGEKNTTNFLRKIMPQ
jgi:hypothetical protein